MTCLFVTLIVVAVLFALILLMPCIEAGQN